MSSSEENSDNNYSSMDEEEIHKNIKLLKDKLKNCKKYQEIKIDYDRTLDIYDIKRVKKISDKEIIFIIRNYSDFDIYYRICRVIPKRFLLIGFGLVPKENIKYFLLQYGSKIFTKNINQSFLVGSWDSFDCFLEYFIDNKYSLDELNKIFNLSTDITWQYYYDFIYKKNNEKINIFSRNNIEIDPIGEKNKQKFLDYIFDLLNNNNYLNIEYFIKMCVKYNYIINGNDLPKCIKYNDDYQIYYIEPKNYFQRRLEGKNREKFIKIINSDICDKSNPSQELLILIEKLNSIKPNIIKLDLSLFRYYFSINNIYYKEVFDSWKIKLDFDDKYFKLLDNGVEINGKFYKEKSREFLFFQELLKFRI